ALSLGPHDAVERGDAVAYEHRNIAGAELLVEARLHLEREAGIAGTVSLARGRSFRGVSRRRWLRLCGSDGRGRAGREQRKAVAVRAHGVVSRSMRPWRCKSRAAIR